MPVDDTRCLQNLPSSPRKRGSTAVTKQLFVWHLDPRPGSMSGVTFLRGDDGFPFITQRYDDLAAYATKKR